MVWVPHSYGLVPYLSKKLCTLLLLRCFLDIDIKRVISKFNQIIITKKILRINSFL